MNHLMTDGVNSGLRLTLIPPGSEEGIEAAGHLAARLPDEEVGALDNRGIETVKSGFSKTTFRTCRDAEIIVCLGRTEISHLSQPVDQARFQVGVPHRLILHQWQKGVQFGLRVLAVEFWVGAGNCAEAMV